jgi:hypothetical protein
VPCPLPRRIKRVRVSITSPLVQPSPQWPRSRHPHCTFRGLLRLYSRYGPPDCSIAQGRPLSRGSSPSGCPSKPLVSYQINRQFPGWILPPLVIRAFGAHGQKGASLQRSALLDYIVALRMDLARTVAPPPTPSVASRCRRRQSRAKSCHPPTPDRYSAITPNWCVGPTDSTFIRKITPVEFWRSQNCSILPSR